MTTLTEAYYRRLYAFHEPSPVIPLEDFYNHNHDPKDGKFSSGRNAGKSGVKGGKVWTGVSAHPDNRVKPKSNVHFPIQPEGYESPGEARAIFGSRIYDADLGDGYQARVVSVTPITNGVSVVIKIRKGHVEVAQASRELTTDEAGRLIAHHETLYVNEAHQGKGIADRFNAHAIAEYQKLGVDHIDLHAGDTVGGYAWARQGYRSHETIRKKYLISVLDRVGSELNKPVNRPHAAKIKADAAALRKAIDAGEDVQPIHLASLGEKYARYTARTDKGTDYPTWPGKSLMLGTGWLGQYFFDANKAVTAAATDLEHAALRNEEFYNQNHDPRDGRFAQVRSSTAVESALQARRSVVPGYGTTARRDIHLAGVRVTYKPDYPDDHPDPGEVVWAKVRYQEDVNQSKDRPVLIIGRINGTDKLAAVQLTSQINGRSNQHVVGPGSWDRLGRNAAVKLDQIIVLDPKDYRREGSTFERARFDDVIGRLAAFHRTPVQIAAGGTWVELYNHEHDPHSGKFTGHGAGAAFRTRQPHKIITKDEARGDSRPVSLDEFNRLATIGRRQLKEMARLSSPTTGLNEHWGTVKSESYAEVRKPWGGATIDAHTGKALAQGTNAYAITVKGVKAQTVSIHENATQAEFNAAMNKAKQRFGPILERQGHHLGVFHDDANHRIDIDPVLVVHRHADVETIGAASRSIGGAYNFKDGNGYWPPHVDTSPTATNSHDNIVRSLYD